MSDRTWDGLVKICGPKQLDIIASIEAQHPGKIDNLELTAKAWSKYRGFGGKIIEKLDAIGLVNHDDKTDCVETFKKRFMQIKRELRESGRHPAIIRTIETAAREWAYNPYTGQPIQQKAPAPERREGCEA